jgi:thymidylate synthase (FAD)
MIEVTCIDHMGSDLTVVNAARVSFGKQKEALGFTGAEGGAMRPILADGDVRLINYLAKHRHMSPFGHCFVSFHVKAPIFVARQLVKHKFLRWNEISRRYVDNPPEFFCPDEWRGRSVSAKQGSTGVVNVGGSVPVGRAEWSALECYRELLRQGVCPEQARMVLPQSTMTEWYWSGSLDAFTDMCHLRLKADTQYETQVVAARIAEYLEDIYPVSWQALMEGDDNG